MANHFITAKEVSQIMECSESYAYKLVKKLNDELKKEGYITRCGRVPRKYFYERVGIEDKSI